MKAVRLFSQIKKRFQIDETRVLTMLADESYYPGELIQGHVRIESMRGEQRVDSLYLKIFTQFEKEMDGSTILVTYPIAKYKLVQTILIPSGKEKVVPFTLQLPNLAPLSVGQARVWLQTELDLANKKDPTHQTDIIVTPTPLFQAFITMCNEMGFRLIGSVCTNQPIAQKFELPCIQTFSFSPVLDTLHTGMTKFEVSIVQATSDELSFYVQWFQKNEDLSVDTLLFEECLSFSEGEMGQWRVHLQEVGNQKPL